MKLKNAISSFLILSGWGEPLYGVFNPDNSIETRPNLSILGFLIIPIVLIVGIIVFIKKRKKKK